MARAKPGVRAGAMSRPACSLAGMRLLSDCSGCSSLGGACERHASREPPLGTTPAEDAPVHLVTTTDFSGGMPTTTWATMQRRMDGLEAAVSKGGCGRDVAHGLAALLDRVRLLEAALGDAGEPGHAGEAAPTRLGSWAAEQLASGVPGRRAEPLAARVACVERLLEGLQQGWQERLEERLEQQVRKAADAEQRARESHERLLRERLQQDSLAHEAAHRSVLETLGAWKAESSWRQAEDAVKSEREVWEGAIRFERETQEAARGNEVEALRSLLKEQLDGARADREGQMQQLTSCIERVDKAGQGRGERLNNLERTAQLLDGLVRSERQERTSEQRRIWGAIEALAVEGIDAPRPAAVAEEESGTAPSRQTAPQTSPAPRSASPRRTPKNPTTLERPPASAERQLSGPASTAERRLSGPASAAERRLSGPASIGTPSCQVALSARTPATTPATT